MQKFYYKAAEGNFGDDLNEWLWDEVLPGLWNTNSSLYFSGIGTILSPWMPKHRHWIICGSGTGYGRPAVDLCDPAVFVAAVRGPLTARVLGLATDSAVTDGAILLSTLPRFRPLSEKERSGTVFVPHRSAFSAGQWEIPCAMAGIDLVDPRGECEAVLQRIRHARLVLADSMHAAIVADTLRVPWIAVATSPEINQFKWLDWALSMGVTYQPINLPASTGAEYWRSNYNQWIAPKVRAQDQVERALEAYEVEHLAAARTSDLRRRYSYRWPQRAARLGNRLLKSDHWFAAKAAKALQGLSSEQGQLSDVSIFQSRRDEFIRRLAIIREKVELFDFDQAKQDT